MFVIGAHMSITKGLDKTAENVVKMNANTMQIFSRNPRGSNFKTPTEKELALFQKIRKEHNFGPILAHAPYTMNLASAKEDGGGEIGLDALLSLLNHPKLQGIPVYLETPLEDEGHANEIAMIKEHILSFT